MATVSITQLPAYTSVLTKTGDVLPIVDITNNTTKKISVATLLASVPTTAVTSVGLALPAPLLVTPSTSPVTSTGTLTATWGSGQIPPQNLGLGVTSASTYLNGLGQWVTLSNAGTVTSVALRMPFPLSVSNSPITTSGEIGVIWGAGQIPPANLGAGDRTPAGLFLASDGIWRNPGGGSGIGSVTSITAGIGLGAPTTGISITTAGTINLLPPSGTAIGGVSAGTGVSITAAGVISVATPTLDFVLGAGNTTTKSAQVGALSIGSAPVLSNDAVRLVDLQTATQLNVIYRPPVSLASISSVGDTYTNNTGLGTATVTGASPLIIDTVVAVVGTRVLLTAQGPLTGATSGVSNGVYTVTANPAVGGTFTLTRVNETLTYGNYHFVTGGNNLLSNSYILNTQGVITVGTTAITYIQFAANPAGATNNPNASGTAAVGTSTKFARENHVHPFSVLLEEPADVATITYSTSTGVLAFTPAKAGAGAVTSVALSTAAAAPLQVTGSPITSSGTFNLSWGGAGFIPPTALADGLPGSTVFLAGDQNWRTAVTQVSASGVIPLNFRVDTPSTTPSIVASWGTGQIPLSNLGGGQAAGTKFLCGNGLWSEALTGVTINGVAPLQFSQTTPTTTPVFTASWGSGQIPPNNLGQGATGSTVYLNGLGRWETVVTSVGIDVSGIPALTATGAVTTSGNISLGWGSGRVPAVNLGTNPADNKVLYGNGTWKLAGSVTSVRLEMPSPVFNVSGNPITEDGTITVAWGTGTVPVANLGTGTLDATTFLNGLGNFIKTGTVTSVSLDTSGLNGISATGSPVTTSGTFVLTWNGTTIPNSALASSGTADATTFLSGNRTWKTALTNISTGTIHTAFDITFTSATTTPVLNVGWGSGLVPTSNLGANTANASSWLCGNQTWANIDINLGSNSTGLQNVITKTAGQWPFSGTSTAGLELLKQLPNTALMGPSSGSITNYPTFRTLVKLDVGALPSGVISTSVDSSYVLQGVVGGDTAAWSRTIRYTAMQSTPTQVGGVTVSGTTVTCNVVNGALGSVTLAGTSTLNVTNLTSVLWDATKAITIAIYHSGAGTTNFINNVTGAGTVRWRGGAAPTVGTASDFYQFTILSPTGPCLASYTAW